jgi:uncharacterized protein (UPF0216 family)
MDEPGPLERWLRLEMGRLRGPLVRAPRPMDELLASTDPSAPTHDGASHRFDPEELRELARHLPPLVRAQLRLPILFYLTHDLPGDAFTSDAAAARALQALHVTDREPRDGKLWIALPVARNLERRFPTLVQFVHR